MKCSRCDYHKAHNCKRQCMDLPEDKTCADCVHVAKCTTMFGAKAGNNHCVFEPIRFEQKGFNAAKELMKMSAKPRGTDNARVIQVIETTALRGEGTEKDTCRQVKQYWDFEGNLLAENDLAEKENGCSVNKDSGNVKMKLKDVKTHELVEELMKREAVEAHVAEPYKDLTVTVNGPAIVLVVTD